jgi:hypothetical protein
MPTAMVRRLLALPPREQQAGWWRWENVQEAQRCAATEAIEQTPPWPHRFAGRGIVVVGGGRYFVSAYVTVRVLRHLGCKLPIELWHLNGEIDAAMQALLTPLGVTTHDAEARTECEPYRFLPGHWWRGWQLKAYALRNSSFREVLLLDADSYPVRNPEFLFDWPRYREWGAIFWPDLERNRGMIPDVAWPTFGVEPFSDLPTEAGQILVNKELCWRELNLAVHYNAQADFVYRILYGDKDTFPMAWQRLGRRYARMWPRSEFDAVAIRQADDRGDLLFLHRVHDKFRMPAVRFDATPQMFERNRFQPQFPLEQFCFDVVSELAESGFESPLLHAHEPRSTASPSVAPQTNGLAPSPRVVLGPGSQSLGVLPLASRLKIEEMYPRVPAEMLVGGLWQQRFREYFLDSGEFSNDPFEVGERTCRPQRKCVSVCLFRQNVDNRVPHELPVDARVWHTKYWIGLQNVVQQMQLLPEWKLRIYVERDLWDEVHAEYAVHPQVELYRMQVNSIGGSPGMLWRFLALSDQSLDLAFDTDIDEPLMTKFDYMRTFERDSRAGLGRIGEFVSDRQYLIAPTESDAKNYATIMGGRVMSRPQLFDLDIAAAMRGFMAHRRHMCASDRPWAYSDAEHPSVYNQPIGHHIYGWGSHWYMYGFDERFLKHVVYYHSAERSQLQTWATRVPPSRLDPEGAADLDFTRSHGNVTVSPHSVVRLADLGLRD